MPHIDTTHTHNALVREFITQQRQRHLNTFFYLGPSSRGRKCCGDTGPEWCLLPTYQPPQLLHVSATNPRQITSRHHTLSATHAPSITTDRHNKTNRTGPSSCTTHALYVYVMELNCPKLYGIPDITRLAGGIGNILICLMPRRGKTECHDTIRYLRIDQSNPPQ